MSDRNGVEIVRATTAAQFLIGRELFEEYQEDIGVDLCFQNFAAELAALPAMYGPPDGALLLALREGETLGCVAVRRLGGRACEMKRLYVRPTARGLGLGRRLALAIIETGRELGYRQMRLDTLPSMEPAQALYRSLGFTVGSAYYDSPIEGVTYMQRSLRGAGG